LARPRKPPEALIELGRIAGAHGVRGWVKATGEIDTLAACGRWWIGGTEYSVEEARIHSNTLLARLAGLQDRDAAQELKGRTVAAERSALPAPEEGATYYADLVGVEVVNLQGEVLGVVKELFHNGAHDVAELAGDRRRLLPWVGAVVKSVDLAARRAEVDWGADW
jgi:16S rRNA processing protein RimM